MKIPYLLRIRILLHHQIILVLLLAGLMSACQSADSTIIPLSVLVNVDGKQLTIATESGVTVEGALSQNGIQLGELDRTMPARNVILTSELSIMVTRVEHVLEILEEEIPFTANILPNETMSLGERRIIQTGLNGLQEVTYQHVIENGKEVSKTIVSRVVIREPQNEIIMEGVQSPNIPVVINGKLVFLTAGNAWLMNGSTINRQPLITSGDLDGHILELSPDGEWLLFSRKPSESEPDLINTLWVVNTVDPGTKPIDLGIANVIHFAYWMRSESRTIVYSTVEKRSTAPGWQANNDLQIIKFTADGGVFSPMEWLAPNTGGVYGWWGDSFIFQSSERKIAILKPDGIDLLKYGMDETTKLIDVLPYQTHGSWSWVTQATWNADGSMLYFVNHRGNEKSLPEESPNFDLDVISIEENSRHTLQSDVGMFAYPSISPKYETDTYLAYLQASFPQVSETSSYRLTVSGPDGSGGKKVFPREGAEGMLPQMIQWQPVGSDSIQHLIAVVYLGNIWFVDFQTGSLQQITGDGLTTKISWR